MGVIDPLHDSYPNLKAEVWPGNLCWECLVHPFWSFSPVSGLRVQGLRGFTGLGLRHPRV